MPFALFILLNAILFIRPAELIPVLQPLRLYQLTILCCIACSYPQIAQKLSSKQFRIQPITCCLMGLFAMIILSHLRHGSLYDARTSGFEFFKLVLYYLLLVSVVNAPERFNKFFACFVVFTAISSGLALLQFYEFVDIPALAAYEQREIDNLTGELIVFSRLCGSGIFNDPNDVCLMLSIAIVLCMYRMFSMNRGMSRFVWLLPIALFLVAFLETKSRGGFLCLATALSVLSACRWGVRRVFICQVLLAPLMIVFVGGRMTNIDVADGTGQHRIQLWREALGLLREYPIFGVGQGMLPEYTRLVAHNSYVHAFAELGIVGGTLFASLVYLAVTELWAVVPRAGQQATDPFDRAGPYLLAIVSGFSVGIVTLSRVYIVPTYLVFGLVTAYLLTRQKLSQNQSEPITEFDSSLALRLSGVGALALITLEVGSRLLVRWES